MIIRHGIIIKESKVLLLIEHFNMMLKKEELMIKKSIYCLRKLFNIILKEIMGSNYNIDNKHCRIGEITICAPDMPGVLCSLLCKLSNVGTIATTTKKPFYMPSFYYSYSFPTRTRLPISKTFVFRGDALITKINNIDIEQLNNIRVCSSVNAENGFKKDIISGLPSGWYNENKPKYCDKYCQRCPISDNNKTDEVDKTKTSNNSLCSSVSIKIWAQYDDIPGSLAISLSDILMMGTSIDNNTSLGNYNIVYETCNLCPNGKGAIKRFYFKEENTRDIESLKVLHRKRPIIAFKIRPTDNNKRWIKYTCDLFYHLNTMIPYKLYCNDYYKNMFSKLEDVNICDIDYPTIIRDDLGDKNTLFVKQCYEFCKTL